jgi:hypothetical protein
MPLGKQKAIVFDCYGPQTDEEMQELLGMGSSTQRPRRVELWEAGLIEQVRDATHEVWSLSRSVARGEP